MLDVSSVRFISRGLSWVSVSELGVIWDGEGDRTTEGIRECPR